MAGLNLSTGFSGVQTTGAPMYGTSDSYASGITSSSAAFAGMTTEEEKASATNPRHPLGMGVWVGIISITALVFIRYSLPN